MLPTPRQFAVGLASLVLFLTPAVAGATELPVSGSEDKKESNFKVELSSADLPDGYLEDDSAVEPAEVSQEQEMALASFEDSNASMAVVEISSPLSVAGLSWESPDEAPTTISYRLLEDGLWSGWHEIKTEAKLGGSDPILLPNVTALEVVVPDAEAEGLSLRVFEADAEEGPTVDSSQTRFERSDWFTGDESEVAPGEPLEPRGVVIHDIEGSSNYQPDQVPALLRAIYHYQSDILGWQDIGYHFVVDKFGNSWEGRQGSYDGPITGGFSTDNGNQALDVVVLDDFAVTEPTDSEMNELAAVTASAFKAGSGEATAELTVGDEHSALSFDAIAGHRDLVNSLSPGDGLYSKLGDLRSLVVEILGEDDQDHGLETTEESPGDQAIPGILAGTTRAGQWSGPTKIGNGWSGQIIFPGDWNRNGQPDMMRIDERGDLYYYQGIGNQRFALPTKIGWGWTEMTWIQGGIDWTGNGNNDIIARHKSGDLYLYRGNGKGGFAGTQKIGNGWNALSNIAVATTSAGTSIYGVTAAGVLVRYPANGNGGFKAKVTYAGGWNAMDHLVGVGNWNGDAYPDFLARKKNGELVLYPGHPGGGIGAGIKVGSGWAGMRWIGASNQRANAQPLWAIDASGNLLSYSFNGKGVGTVVAPAPKLPAKVTYKNGVYTFNMVHSAQQTNYWCGPASVFMVLERLDYVKSTKGAWLSQSALAGNAYLQTDRYGKTSWAMNNLSTGVAAWTGNKVKYTRQAAPSAATFRTRVSDSVTKTGRPIIVDAQEYYGGSHYNNHPVYSEFSHLMPVQSYNPSTDMMTVLDPASHYYANSSKVFSHKVGAFAPYLSAFGIYY